MRVMACIVFWTTDKSFMMSDLCGPICLRCVLCVGCEMFCPIICQNPKAQQKLKKKKRRVLMAEGLDSEEAAQVLWRLAGHVVVFQTVVLVSFRRNFGVLVFKVFFFFVHVSCSGVGT
jgi:hypothetical protein